MTSDRRQRRWFLAGLLLFQAATFFYLVLSRRIPAGHDTQSVYLLQYLFLSHASSVPGSVLWMPYLAHGIVSTWFSNLQAGPIQNVLLLVGGAPEETSMGAVFYAGLFFEDLVLLIGVWRLGERFCRTAAAQGFIGLATVGSSLWISNVYWNHRLLFAVPLILALLLDVLESGSRWKLFAASVVSTQQLMGNALYIPVLSAIAIGSFLGVYAVVYRKRLRSSLPLLRPRRSDAGVVLGIAAVFVPVLIFLLRGLGSIRQYQLGRNTDGSVPFDTFLTYEGGSNPLRYLDLLVGITPSKDYSVYCGLCTVVFAVLAVFLCPGRRVLQMVLSLLLMVFFSMGYLAIAGMFGYYAFPPLHYFRYVSLAAPLVKMFLILLAGLGFDAFARRPGAASARRFRIAAAIIVLLIAQFGYLRIQQEFPSEPLSSFLQKVRDGLAIRPSGPPGNLNLSVAAAALLSAGVLAALARRRAANEGIVIALLLGLHGVDLFRWRLQSLREETVALDERQYEVQRIRSMPYIARRTPTDLDNPRSSVFGRDIFNAGMRSGTVYDYCDAFLHRDPSWSPYFVTMWSPSVDLLLRAHAGRPLGPDREAPPPFLSNAVVPPRTLPEGFAKVIGEGEDKLQVFSGAHPATDAQAAELLQRSDYRGDVLLVEAAEAASPPEPALAAANERVAVAPRVSSFSADRIVIDVDLPPSQPAGWLLYCDSWHPRWKATVDGAVVAVERANLAYKAVRLHAGSNRVEFRFQDPVRKICGTLVGLLSLFFGLLVAAWTLKILGAWPVRQDR